MTSKRQALLDSMNNGLPIEISVGGWQTVLSVPSGLAVTADVQLVPGSNDDIEASVRVGDGVSNRTTGRFKIEKKAEPPAPLRLSLGPGNRVDVRRHDGTVMVLVAIVQTMQA